MHTTSRLGLQVPDGTDDVNLYPANASQAFGILDTATTFSSGTVAGIPAASMAGRYYYATDVKQLFFDNGSTWMTQTPETFTAMTALRETTWTPNSSSFAVVPLNVIFTDTGNHFNTSTHTYTCPAAGTYEASGMVSLVSGGSGQFVSAYVQVSGSPATQFGGPLIYSSATAQVVSCAIPPFLFTCPALTTVQLFAEASNSGMGTVGQVPSLTVKQVA